MVWFITTSKQPYKLPVIYDQEYRIDSLLDTGAPTSFIATHVLRQMEKEGKPYYRLPSRIDFFGVNALPLQTEGMVYLQTEIIDENGNTLTRLDQPFYVTEQTPTEVILGRDWIQNTGIATGINSDGQLTYEIPKESVPEN